MTSGGVLALILLVIAVVLAWLAVLTVAFVRWRLLIGEPVYRRLPNGRLRFEWNVSQAYEAAQGRAMSDRPIPARSRS